MNLANAFGCDGASFQPAFINPFLDSNVGLRFELQVAFACVLAVVVLQGPFDVNGVRVVSLD